MLENRYNESALYKMELVTLAKRREALCLSFAERNLKNRKLKQHFVQNENTHVMKTRNPHQFDIKNAHTERLRRSPVYAETFKLRMKI